MRLRPSLNSALGLKLGWVGTIAARPSPGKVYEEDDVAGNEPGGVLTLLICIFDFFFLLTPPYGILLEGFDNRLVNHLIQELKCRK